MRERIRALAAAASLRTRSQPSRRRLWIWIAERPRIASEFESTVSRPRPAWVFRQQPAALLAAAALLAERLRRPAAERPVKAQAAPQQAKKRDRGHSRLALQRWWRAGSVEQAGSAHRRHSR